MIRRFTTFAILCLLAVMAVQADAHTLTMNVVDATTGEHLSFRGSVTDAGDADRYPLPADSCYYHTSTSVYHEWWYATSPCTLAIPTGGEGTVTVRAGHGFEFRPDTLQVEVTADVACTLSLTPLTAMSALGWYSGDTESDMNHGGGIYTCDETDALITCEAEDLDAIVCESGGAEFTGTPTTSGGRAVFTTYEMRHQRYGHLCPILAQGLPDSTVWATNLSPCLNDIADSMAAAGPSPDLLIHMNHASEWQPNFRISNFTETPGGANWPREAISLAWHRVIDAYNCMFGSDGLTKTRLQHIWNSGIKLTATGGTDSALNSIASGPPGSMRTYAKLDGAFTFSAWAEAIRDGHTFVTNGPIFTAWTVDGADPGDSLTFTNCATETLALDLAFESVYPVKRVDYIQNGTRVGGKVFTVESTAWDTLDTITAQHGGGWVTAQLTGDDPGWFICSGSTDTMSAMTSPVWYTMAGMRPNVNASATWASGWCDSLVNVATWFHDGGYATFSSSEESTRVLGLFAEAGTGYAALAAQATYTVGSGGDYATIALAIAGDADENDTLILLDGGHNGPGATAIPSGMTIRSQGPEYKATTFIRPVSATVSPLQVAAGPAYFRDLSFRTTTVKMLAGNEAFFKVSASGDVSLFNCRFANVDNNNAAAGNAPSCFYVAAGCAGIRMFDSQIDSTSCSTAGNDYIIGYIKDPTDFIMRDCEVTRTTAPDRAPLLIYHTGDVDSTEITGTLFALNTSADYGIIFLLDNIATNINTFDYCTFAENTCTDTTDGVIAFDGAGQVGVMKHSIVSGSNGVAFKSTAAPDTMHYCDLYGNNDNTAYGDQTGNISVDPDYATTSLDSTRAYMALSGAGAGPNYPRYTADGGYMGWLEPTKLPAPTLVSPTDLVRGENDPTLTWNSVAYADSYAVKIGKTCGSGTYAAGTDTTYMATTNPFSTYYWRAKTYGPDGWGPWSACYRLRAGQAGDSGERRRRH